MINSPGWTQSRISENENLETPISFTKTKIASESYESVGVFDVNDDKVPDLVSGAFWYEGPDYVIRHFIGSSQRYGEYWDDFSTIPMDVNGDGRLDFITGGWFGGQLVWKENPGNEQEWQVHKIAETGNIETTRAWDIDGDGILEVIPNTPNDSLVIYHLIGDEQGKGTGRFKAYGIMGKHGHGLGFGDINGDGRGDLLVHNGWLEAPKEPFSGTWAFHSDFNFGTASIPILVVDVNQDGLNDAIVGQAHGYGLDWYKQKVDDRTKVRSWTKHPIDLYNSQFHTMEWVDLDGDGQMELLTGKRYRAHNGHDPGGNDPVGIYYYKWNGESFSKQVISYGIFGKGKGTGIYFVVKDLNGSGRKDIIVAGKDGLYIFYNKPI
ncbi:VCBS repeat-containing protein [Flavobacteriaceae bacterium F89]|uniref:VCBS repeat-containing protein n=1 Tax=Cerina litoralis TaxID=2874477 RepID=A0AAE3ESC5_9FLAO|nr:VCBS repeat-containing protein [Cerina litoralis]MCG2460073.1 VCBS repeat-containing protein [Cerina litoralis]